MRVFFPFLLLLTKREKRKIAIYFSKIATGRKNSEIGSYFGVSGKSNNKYTDKSRKRNSRIG